MPLKIMILVAATCIGTSMVSHAQTSSVYRDLQIVAKELNKMTPLQKDGVTRVDSIGTLPKDIMIYYCTLIDTARDPLEVKRIVERKMLDRMRTSPKEKLFREYRITMQMKYVDLKGNPLFLISLTPDKYLKE